MRNFVVLTLMLIVNVVYSQHGVVDLRIVEDLQQQVTQLTGTIAQNDVTIQNLTSEIAQLQLQLEICKGGTEYANKNYFVPDGGYNFDDAQTACEERGGRLAAVTSTDVYDALEGFLRSIVVAEGAATLWFRMAMTFDPTRDGRNKEITSLDGRTVTWKKWFPGYPRTTSSSSSGYASWTSMVWRVEETASSTHQGFLNYTPSYSHFRALCRKSM